MNFHKFLRYFPGIPPSVGVQNVCTSFSQPVFIFYFLDHFRLCMFAGMQRLLICIVIVSVSSFLFMFVSVSLVSTYGVCVCVSILDIIVCVCVHSEVQMKIYLIPTISTYSQH